MSRARDTLACLVLLALLFVAGGVYRVVRDADALVKEANTRMVGTSQNLNALLIQAGLAMDNVRRASESQKAVSTKTLALLDSANALLLHTQKNTDEITLHTVQAMDGVKPVLAQLTLTLQDVNKLVSDQNIPLILGNLNDTSKQAVLTMQHTDETMSHVDAMTGEAQGWLHKELKPPSVAKRIYNFTVSTLIVVAHFL